MLIFMGYDEYHIKKVLKFRYPNGPNQTPAQIYNLAISRDRLVAKFKFSELEIIEALEIYELMELEFKNRKEPKMTREEAIKKLYDLNNQNGRNEELIKALEALGLIKFEEAKPSFTIEQAIDIARMSTMGTNHNQCEFIKMLGKHGYKVTKI